MSFKDFVEIYKGKSTSEKLTALVMAEETKGSQRVQAQVARYCWRNEEAAQECEREIKAQDERIRWLCEEIAAALSMQETGVN